MLVFFSLLLVLSTGGGGTVAARLLRGPRAGRRRVLMRVLPITIVNQNLGEKALERPLENALVAF